MKTNSLTRAQRKAIAKAVPFPYWTIVYGVTTLFALLWILQALRST